MVTSYFVLVSLQPLTVPADLSRCDRLAALVLNSCSCLLLLLCYGCNKTADLGNTGGIVLCTCKSLPLAVLMNTLLSCTEQSYCGQFCFTFFLLFASLTVAKFVDFINQMEIAHLSNHSGCNQKVTVKTQAETLKIYKF